MGNRHRLTAPYQLFETSDKRYVAIGMPNNMLFQKFMQVIGSAHISPIRALPPTPIARPTRIRCWPWSSRRSSR